MDHCAACCPVRTTVSYVLPFLLAHGTRTIVIQWNNSWVESEVSIKQECDWIKCVFETNQSCCSVENRWKAVVDSNGQFWICWGNRVCWLMFREAAVKIGQIEMYFKCLEFIGCSDWLNVRGWWGRHRYQEWLPFLEWATEEVVVSFTITEQWKFGIKDHEFCLTFKQWYCVGLWSGAQNRDLGWHCLILYNI